MLRDPPPRQREFSQVRSCYLTHPSLSPLSNNTPRKVHHAVLLPFKASSHIHTPPQHHGSRRANHSPIPTTSKRLNTTFTKSPLKTTQETPSKEFLTKSYQKEKKLEYCNDCVNGILAVRRNKKEREDERKEELYIEKCKKIARENANIWEQRERERMVREFKDCQEDNKRMVKEKEIKQKKQENIANETALREMRDKLEASEGARKVALINNRKREKLQQELKQQIQQDKIRKEKEEKLDKTPEVVLEDRRYLERMREVEMRRNESYKNDLIQQMEEKKERVQKKKQQEKRTEDWNLAALENPQNSPYYYESIKRRQYERDLEQQIDEAKARKTYQKQKQEREFAQAYDKQKKEIARQVQINEERKQYKLDKYRGALQEQMAHDRSKRLREEEARREPAVMWSPEPPVCLQPCDGCHKRVPHNYLSTIEPA